MACGVGVRGLRGNGLDVTALADPGDVHRRGAGLARALEDLHGIARARRVAQHDHAVLFVDGSLVRGEIGRVRRVGVHPGLAKHPRSVVRRVPARPHADQQDPAAGEPRRGGLGRTGVRQQPAELLGL